MNLENEYLLVEIADKGAEVVKIYDKQKAVDVLWEGNPAFWKRHSPILFPNVRKNYKNTIHIQGKEYPSSQHGFARDHVFTCVKSDESQGIFLLCSDEETKKVYPFDFELYISYVLERKTLSIQWEVKNPTAEPVYFTIGGHPAFRFSGKEERKEDYCLFFPKKEKLQYILINPESGTACVERIYELELNKGMYPLSEEMFSEDALIFDNGQIGEAWICHKDGRPYVGLRCEGFPNFGIWSVEGAPFICLEPWAGRCDNHGFEGDISEKPGMNRVDGHGTFKKQYQIVVA